MKESMIDCGIKLFSARNVTDYEFEDGVMLTRRSIQVLNTLPKNRIVEFSTDDGPEDLLTLSQLNMLSEYGYFCIHSRTSHTHYVFVTSDVVIR